MKQVLTQTAIDLLNRKYPRFTHSRPNEPTRGYTGYTIFTVTESLIMYGDYDKGRVVVPLKEAEAGVEADMFVLRRQTYGVYYYAAISACCGLGNITKASSGTSLQILNASTGELLSKYDFDLSAKDTDLYERVSACSSNNSLSLIEELACKVYDCARGEHYHSAINFIDVLQDRPIETRGWSLTDLLTLKLPGRMHVMPPFRNCKYNMNTGNPLVQVQWIIMPEGLMPEYEQMHIIAEDIDTVPEYVVPLNQQEKITRNFFKSLMKIHNTE